MRSEPGQPIPRRGFLTPEIFFTELAYYEPAGQVQEEDLEQIYIDGVRQGRKPGTSVKIEAPQAASLQKLGLEVIHFRRPRPRDIEELKDALWKLAEKDEETRQWLTETPAGELERKFQEYFAVVQALGEAGLYAVAQPRKFLTVASKAKLARFLPLPRIGHKLALLFEQLRDRSVAETIAFLNQYGPRDPDYTYPFDLPEASILLGVAFGYPVCDIEYFIRTRYLGEERYASRGEEVSDPLLPHVLCPSCAEKLQAGKPIP